MTEKDGELERVAVARQIAEQAARKEEQEELWRLRAQERNEVQQERVATQPLGAELWALREREVIQVRECPAPADSLWMKRELERHAVQAKMVEAHRLRPKRLLIALAIIATVVAVIYWIGH